MGSGYICSICGAGFGDAGAAAAHLAGAHKSEGSYYQGSIPVGSIHHDAVTEKRWVEDSAGYESHSLIGYRCECGEEITVKEYQQLQEDESKETPTIPKTAPLPGGSKNEVQ